MTEEEFARYDSADYLKTEGDIAAYLEALMEEGGVADCGKAGGRSCAA